MSEFFHKCKKADCYRWAQTTYCCNSCEQMVDSEYETEFHSPDCDVRDNLHGSVPDDKQ